MKKMANFAGILGLLTLCASLVSFILLPNELLVNGLWTSALLLFGIWAFLQREGILSFLVNRRTRHGANVSLIVFLVLGILVFVNMIAKEHSFRTDITRGAKNSLSDQSVKLVDSLHQDVKAYYFNTLREKDRGELMLKNFAHRSPHFKYEFVDTDRRPTFAQGMGISTNDMVMLQIEGTTKQQKVTGAKEEAITNGLMKLLRTQEQSVYFVNGHRERSIEDASALGYLNIKNELERQGYAAKPLSILAEGKIPADAAVLVIDGPQSAFHPKELEILGDWLKNHGHLFASVELDIAEKGLAKGSQQLAGLLKPYGIEVFGQMLVDPNARAANVESEVLFGFSASREHPITRAFPHSNVQNTLAVNFFFPITTYLKSSEKEDMTFTPLVTTTPQAWAEADWNEIKSGAVRFNEGKDVRGPLTLGLAAEEIAKGNPGEDVSTKPHSRLVVFGTSTVVQNSEVDKLFNRDLFLNSIAWLANDERFISIRPRDDNDGLRYFSNGVVNLVLVLALVVPALVAIWGVIVWWRRTKK